MSEDYAARFLSTLSHRPICDWCKHPNEPVYRAKLCGHCYRIHTRVNSLRAEVEKCKKRGKCHSRFGPVPPALDFRFRAYRKMEENAKAEGRIYGNIPKDDIGALRLEHEFSFISKRFVKKDLYHGDANLFDWTFSANQKRVIFYLLSLMSREYLRKRRKWTIPDHND